MDWFARVWHTDIPSSPRPGGLNPRPLVVMMTTFMCVVCGVQTLSEDTSYFLRNFAQGAGALGMMAYTSPQLCLIMMGVIPPVAAWAVFFGRKVHPRLLT
jgi:hypothetical protein